MFKSLSRRSVGGAKPEKFKFELEVVQLDNIPQAVKKCRVVWARKVKVQMTESVDTKRGVCPSSPPPRRRRRRRRAPLLPRERRRRSPAAATATDALPPPLPLARAAASAVFKQTLPTNREV